MNKRFKQFIGWLWWEYVATEEQTKVLSELERIKRAKNNIKNEVVGRLKKRKVYKYPDKMPKYFKSARLA